MERLEIMSTAFLEMPAVQEQPVVELPIPPAIAPSARAEYGFTEEQLAAMTRDDAMAGGMISIILGIAFSVLVCLALGVGIWTSMVME